MVSYLVHYDTLLQKVTKVYYKIGKFFSLQNATVFTKYDDFIRKCNVYNKMRRYNVYYRLQMGNLRRKRLLSTKETKGSYTKNLSNCMVRRCLYPVRIDENNIEVTIDNSNI